MGMKVHGSRQATRLKHSCIWIFKSDVWQESYWTLTQPPLPRYFIGFGRRLGGFNESQLNQPIDFFLTEAENIAREAYPDEKLLHWARMPMAVLTSFSLFLLFYLMENRIWQTIRHGFFGPCFVQSFFIFQLASGSRRSSAALFPQFKYALRSSWFKKLEYKSRGNPTHRKE